MTARKSNARTSAVRRALENAQREQERQSALLELATEYILLEEGAGNSARARLSSRIDKLSAELADLQARMSELQTEDERAQARVIERMSDLGESKSKIAERLGVSVGVVGARLKLLAPKETQAQETGASAPAPAPEHPADAYGLAGAPGA